MRSGIFGWSYPPGAANDPNAPYNQEDLPCDICGKFPDNCICPECPTCGEFGHPNCYELHGLVRSQEQMDSLKNELAARTEADVETCPQCHGYGIEVISETNNQYDRTIQQQDTCSRCGGEGIIIIERG